MQSVSSLENDSDDSEMAMSVLTEEEMFNPLVDAPPKPPPLAPPLPHSYQHQSSFPTPGTVIDSPRIPPRQSNYYYYSRNSDDDIIKTSLPRHYDSSEVVYERDLQRRRSGRCRIAMLLVLILVLSWRRHPRSEESPVELTEDPMTDLDSLIPPIMVLEESEEDAEVNVIPTTTHPMEVDGGLLSSKDD